MPGAVMTKAKTITVGQYLLDQLQANGVNHIFGIPGDYVLPFDKMIEQHTIQFINTTRENPAGFMADAYARVRGLGAACITYGVGINIANAVSQAYVENSPLVVISGAANTQEFSSSQRLHHLFNKPLIRGRDTTQLEIFKKITVAQTVLDNPSIATHEIDRVLGHCLCQKKPVYIELPRDQATAPITQEIRHQEKNSHHVSDPSALKEVIGEMEEIIKNCKRPIIWAGHELNRFRLSDTVLHFAEKYRIPIVTSLLGKSAVSEHHPLFVGVYQGKLSREEVRSYVDSCDCVFILGVILNDVDTGMFTVDLKQKQKIQATSEMISINHHQYHGIFFTDFIHALSTLNLNVRFKDDYPASIDRGISHFKVKKSKITSERLFECLQSHLSRDHLIVCDFGDCLFGGAELVVEQNSFFSNAYFATLGFGVPGAVGVQIACPEKRVICLVGDGAFQMTGMELSTALRYQIDPIIILLNNHGYATERPILEGEFNDIVNWDYSKFPELLKGGYGVQVKTEEEFNLAVKHCLENRGTYSLIEVELGKTDFSRGLQRFSKLVGNKAKTA